ncbi:hypothetical protein [Flavobacterium sp. NKUCC04_CG]|uniref:hypothetical protein n=1 Tax=Flavobacterium sp. NKUCC04_CG TaxID=2842121 RepID=UPI002107233F|nr:hypothetical protein [Flavobacterium sp. NKUCC04_CG]
MIKLVYKPFSTYRNIRFLSGSERQFYDANTQYFNPDRRLDPLVILVECGVTDPHGFKTGLVNQHLTDVKWKISESGVLKDILPTDTEFVIGTGVDKGWLKIFKNIADTESATLIFTAKYFDIDSKRTAHFQQSFVLLTTPTAVSPAVLETNCPHGENLFLTQNKAGLVVQAQLFRETSVLPAAYYWYKNGVEITDSGGYLNSKSSRLFVPASEISQTGTVITVEVADCSNDLKNLNQDGNLPPELPANYRPDQKPAKVYKGDFLLMKKYPKYQEEILITQGGINPSVTFVEAEMIINTCEGTLKNPENAFSVGWLKQPDGRFLYKGFKIKIPIEKIVELHSQNKQLDVELREDLTLKE